MLAITGGKGGTGTTTTALGLAWALGGRRASVAVDGDWRLPNLHALAGVGRGWDAETPCGLPAYPPRDDSTAPEVAGARFYRPACGGSETDDDSASDTTAVLPAPAEPATRDRGALFRRLQTLDRPVVVDCPSGVGPDATAPLRSADAAVLVTTTCAPAVRDTQKSSRQAAAVETPVTAVAVTRTATVPTRLDAVFDAPTVGVPPATPPVLDDDGVRAAYQRLARAVTDGATPSASETT